jgi:hypothetical protein
MISIMVLSALGLAQKRGAVQSKSRTVYDWVESANLQLEAMGENVRIDRAEYITWTDTGFVGQTIYFNNRTKQLDFHWVPGDPRPGRDGRLDITWVSDMVDGTANGVDMANTQAAIGRAMNTWDKQVCSDVELTKVMDWGLDLGFIQFLLGMGGVPGWLADITQAGFLPGAFFEISLEPGASDAVIGVTFTFRWTDENDEFTDIDNNGKLDVAFREIYYNNEFQWGIDTSLPVDVETIVLHETGHGLSLGHFGKLFQTNHNEKFHFAPLALMNAGYTGIRQDLLGTDTGAFCSVWGSWPNR